MARSASESLPLAPLLLAYTRTRGPLTAVPSLGTRFGAITSARITLLDEAFLDQAPEAGFRDALLGFYRAVAVPPLHAASLARRAGIVRHGIAMLLRGRDPLPLRLAQCLQPGGAYCVPGVGPVFWSALAQALDPARNPGWTPAILEGARRLGLVKCVPGSGAALVYGRLLDLYGKLLNSGALASAQEIDHFLTRVAGTTGRTLAPDEDASQRWRKVVAQIRAGGGLREQLKTRGSTLARAQHLLAQALARCDGPALLAALADADPDSAARAPLDALRHAEGLISWVGRFWETAEVTLPTVLEAFWQADPIPGAGLWLPPAVLHLRDPLNYPPWSEVSRAAFAALDDAPTTGRPVEDYALYREGVAWLRERLTLHPLEVPAFLRALAPDAPERGRENGAMHFEGFGADAFAFLADLAAHNERPWMARHQARYRFSVRQPLVELCQALARRYIEPVLHCRHGWDLDTEARPGHALTSICKNAFGRGGLYNSVLWITFRLRGKARSEQPQLFVRLDAHGLRFGLRLGRSAKVALQRLRGNLERHGPWVLAALRARGVEGHETVESLMAWANGKGCEIGTTLAAADPLLTSEGLVGEILLAFDRLLPLLAASLDDDPTPALQRLGIAQPEAGSYTTGDFLRATYLDAPWLDRARGLLEIKKQLILQGVPGTGKTHVARCLARLLTAGRDECVRLVQFHPAYSYEEFVEGIKVRTVEVNGRHEPTYPVEEGLLCTFAEQATAAPTRPHVLIVDEINRGNLPRIFGELLYLLEYREQAVVLPYSRRRFQLPANLYLLGTMNAADRSVALVDQALRRRFSFLEMAPDASVLAAWLQAHPPAGGPDFAQRVLDLFDRLNAKLSFDLGPTATVGHSVFMVPDLDEDKLRLVWSHHVLPLVQEHVAGRPERLAGYELEKLEREPRRKVPSAN